MSKMKAWVITNYGGPEVLELMDIEKPKCKDGKLLVKIHYAALNPYDFKIRDGFAKWMTGKKFPKVLGGDFMGEIVESNAKKSQFNTGQLVYGFANIFMREQGSLAEFTMISPKYVRPLPDNIDSINASAITSAGLTAISGIEKCKPLSDKVVLVNGATGGIGHLATQIFVEQGCDVTAVCSTKNIKVAESLGVSKVIDYKNEEVLSKDTMYDIIYDAAAKLNFKKAKKQLNKNGIYCTTEEGFTAVKSLIWSKFILNKKMCISNFKGKTTEFIKLESLVSKKGVNPIVSNYSFSQVDKAFKTLEEGSFNGKLVIKVLEQ